MVAPSFAVEGTKAIAQRAYSAAISASARATGDNPVCRLPIAIAKRAPPATSLARAHGSFMREASRTAGLLATQIAKAPRRADSSEGASSLLALVALARKQHPADTNGDAGLTEGARRSDRGWRSTRARDGQSARARRSRWPSTTGGHQKKAPVVGRVKLNRPSTMPSSTPAMCASSCS